MLTLGNLPLASVRLKYEMRTWCGRCRVKGHGIYKGCSVILMAVLRGSWYARPIKVQMEVISAQFGIRRQTQAIGLQS